MCQSDQINELAKALNAAQSQIMVATKDAKNPFFKSTYATLNSVWDAVKDAVLANGLTIIQPIACNDGHPVVKTTIMHTSGQYITSECPIVCAKQNDPQALGSAITYARRYSLASMLGVMTDDDDDAEKAMNRPRPSTSQPSKSLKDRAASCIKWLATKQSISEVSNDYKNINALLQALSTAGMTTECTTILEMLDNKLIKMENA